MAKNVRKRVRDAAEVWLKEERVVGPLEVLVGMNLLAYSSYRQWLKGLQKDLGVQIQGGPKLHSQVIQHFLEWVQEKGLVPMNAPYVAASRGGTKALRVFREHDEEREQLYTSRFAVPGAEKKVKKKLEKKPDLVVMISASRKERECVHCKAKVYKGTFFLMEDDGMVCLECADMDHLLFLPSGDAALTRRSRKYSSLCAVVVEFSRSRGRYERQGLLVTEEAVNQAEEECIKDADQRAARREERRARVAQEDEAYARDVEDALSVWYPNCPAEEIQSIAYHTTVRGSGRVGRSSAARELLRDMFKLAVIAHIRHQHTNYDELLMSGVPREEARMSIHNEVSEILRRWQGE